MRISDWSSDVCSSDLLRALKFPPFYALDIRPGEFSTVAGVATDAHGQILKDGYSPVPGLYAIGIDANSIFRGHYPGAGSAIGPAMAFGHFSPASPRGTRTGPERATKPTPQSPGPPPVN